MLNGTALSLRTVGQLGHYAPNTTGSVWGSQSAHWLGIRFRVDGGAASGRLEISMDGGTTWGTVCDDAFSDNSARVVCQSMGYADGTMVANTATTDGTGSIMLDNFQCNDDARNFLECRVAPLGTHNCGHTEDVGVACVL